MKPDIFQKNTLKCAVAAAAFILEVTALPVTLYAASGEEIYGGANGLVKDAIDVIRNTDTGSAGGASFNMDIETTIEHDLSGTILDGVYIDDIDLSGKTYDEAVELVSDKVNSMADANITLNSIDGHSVSLTAQDLGMTWDDKKTIEDALYLGRSGNLVERYKQRKDIEHESAVYP
ncbi:MAG: hypothetical protein IKQ40_02710, partial [Lachnospiraceae bacterium]|nr:hypothetical protein [Lachnospiraceae bacterium]